MQQKKNRKLKVYAQSSGHKYADVPTIVLKGKWLEAAGFEVGDIVQVDIENKRLIIKGKEE